MTSNVPIGFAVVLVGVGAVFGYHLWLGWRTGIVRFPLSVLVFEEFERDQSPDMFWGVMAVDVLGLLAAFTVAGLAFAKFL